MAIANRYKIKVALQPFNWTASRFIKTGLLIFSVFFSFVNGQSGNELKELVQAQSELDNGNYLKAVELAGVGVEKAKKQKNNSQVSQGLDIAARSKISLAEYESAFNALDEALRIVSEDDKNAYRKALIFIRFAWLMRSQRRFAEAFDYSKKAVAAAPENRRIQAEHFFTLDKKLLAFVWEKGKAVQTVELSISEDELEKLAAKTHQNIKTGVFFKRDGKAIYEKLLKPLALTSGHLIIVPDKALWKIPFQALSPDGEKYLIEEKLVSYAPSVSILLEQLKNPEPDRQSLQAFANSNYENRILQNVNAEAISVAEIYNSKPLLNATITDYERNSEQADILHFSMHAEVDNEQPLESFLGFRKFGKDDGRLTVENHLKIKLKKGSLVFLASCDTNNVLNGEGLVSLAWAMMGSGATTVISAQWEANDKSTEIFTKAFYRHYKQGNSSAEAMQKASLELIKNKSNNMHEPYYWADFTLNGDFR